MLQRRWARCGYLVMRSVGMGRDGDGRTRNLDNSNVARAGTKRMGKKRKYGDTRVRETEGVIGELYTVVGGILTQRNVGLK
jgi:hypothetical protein